MQRSVKRKTFKEAVQERVETALQNSRLLAQVKQLQLDLEEAQELVYPIAELRREQAAAVFAMKSKLLAAPSKIAPRLIGATDPHKIESQIREVIEESLNELADLGTEETMPQKVRDAILEWTQGE